MNLKKIIKESLENDWGWTQFEPIQPRKPGEVRIGDIYTIYGNNYHVRYVLEIVSILGNTIWYTILETEDGDEDEFVGSKHSVSKTQAKELILYQGYWKLTYSEDNNFIYENDESLKWIKDIIPVEQMVKDALRPNPLYRVETKYDDYHYLIELEIYATDGSGRFFGVEGDNVSYTDVLNASYHEFKYCVDSGNTPQKITDEYRELYNLLNYNQK